MSNRAGTSNEQYLDKAMDIFALLLRTRETGNYIKAHEIQSITSIDTRIIADMVRCFQRQGFPIISGDGYKWAKDRREWLHHCWKERKRFRTGYENVSKAAKKYTQVDQPTFWEQPKQEAVCPA